MSPVLHDGGGTGVPLVCVHGWASGPGLWRTYLPDLAPAFRPLYVELPGHGDDARIPQPRLDDYVRDLVDAVPGPAIWLGWSLGALVCLAAALLRPDAVSRLVLVAANPRFTRTTDWPFGIRPDLFHSFAEDLRLDPGRTLRRFHGLAVQGAADSRRHLTTLRRVSASASHADALGVTLHWLRDGDYRARLAELRSPVCWILGEGDPLISPELGHHLRSRYPGWRVDAIAGGGHIPFAVAPSRIRAALDDAP